MRINNLHVSGMFIGAPRALPETDATPAELGERTGQDVSTHTPSPELTRWISLAAQVPEIREDVVQRVANLLVRGGYLTAEAAQRTAAAILRLHE